MVFALVPLLIAVPVLLGVTILGITLSTSSYPTTATMPFAAGAVASFVGDTVETILLSPFESATAITSLAIRPTALQTNDKESVNTAVPVATTTIQSVRTTAPLRPLTGTIATIAYSRDTLAALPSNTSPAAPTSVVVNIIPTARATLSTTILIDGIISTVLMDGSESGSSSAAVTAETPISTDKATSSTKTRVSTHTFISTPVAMINSGTLSIFTDTLSPTPSPISNSFQDGSTGDQEDVRQGDRLKEPEGHEEPEKPEDELSSNVKRRYEDKGFKISKYASVDIDRSFGNEDRLAFEKRAVGDGDKKGSLQSSTSNSSKSRIRKNADIAKLEHWINQTVHQRSAHYEQEVYNIVDDILQDEEASKYKHVFEDWALSATRQPIRGQRQLIQEAVSINNNNNSNSTGNAKAGDVSEIPSAPLNDTINGNLENGHNDGNSGSNQNVVQQFIGSLLQPLILQLRADIRNVVIWLCAGAPGSKIDGRMNGSDEFSRKMVDDDFIATHHADGSHPLSDIIDPGIAGMIVDCLKGRYKDFVDQLDALVWSRLNQVKNFLLDKLVSLTGIPRYLIPLSFSPPEDDLPMVEQSVITGQSGKDRVLLESQDADGHMEDMGKRLEAIGWMFNSVMDKTRLLATEKATTKSDIQKHGQDHHHHHRKESRMGSRQRGGKVAAQQRLQLPVDKGSTEYYRPGHAMKCGWIEDRLD
ncbi:hypothetical protein BGZ99_007623 [Dissophora globulifera]|uniref:Uncharacterized protein n=1 Tax=Dissophora globulifera TaxID=979702 RepID=A0A9P6UQH7_9FUNG|nr:hypothetical protein BGZ99_007623 [Dissophora globulifera]